MSLIAMEVIRRAVPRRERLLLWAEESVELAHALLKLVRVEDGINPTPVSREEALAQVLEELADVELCGRVACDEFTQHEREQIEDTMSAKAVRWVQRLEDADAVP